MKRLLLVACDYPPPTTIAGLIPSRLARQLPALGWEVEVVRNAKFAAKPDAKRDRPARRSPGTGERFGQWLPFGDAVFSIPQMIKDATRLHTARPFHAILVSAAPVAATLAGHRLAKTLGLPVVHMHGDPWGPCTQRAPMRPFWTTFLEGSAERAINTRASALILNTETARSDYLKAFPDLKPDNVHVLRSPHDADAMHGQSAPEFDAPTLLFPGRFSSHAPPEPLFTLAEHLKAHGLEVTLATTDDPGPRDAQAMIPWRVIDPVPQAAMVSLMENADILLAISQKTNQRIPLKLSDYLCSNRPVVVLEQTPNPELRDFVRASKMGAVFGLSEMEEATLWIEAHLKSGRRPERARDAATVEAMSARNSAIRLTQILDSVLDRRQ